MDHQDVFNSLKSSDHNFDDHKINNAVDLAIKYEGGRSHVLIQIAKIIVEMNLESDIVIAALLYHSAEEGALPFQVIEQYFDPQVSHLISAVLKLAEVDFSQTPISHAEILRKILLTMDENTRIKALLIKFIETWYNNNLPSFSLVQPIKKHQYIALKIMESYLPLIERTRIESLKIELQDFCFNILYPEERMYIVSRLRSISMPEENLVNKVADNLRKTLEKAGIGASVSGRLKSPYSIWMKMEQKNISLEKLSDIIAFRVIVDNKEECYKTLEVIQNNYEIVPENLQDFISEPKDNGYQSIHTVVIGPAKQNIEIQIRTKEMHDEAEFGEAAHWRYKREARSHLQKIYSVYLPLP